MPNGTGVHTSVWKPVSRPPLNSAMTSAPISTLRLNVDSTLNATLRAQSRDTATCDWSPGGLYRRSIGMSPDGTDAMVGASPPAWPSMVNVSATATGSACADARNSNCSVGRYGAWSTSSNSERADGAVRSSGSSSGSATGARTTAANDTRPNALASSWPAQRCELSSPAAAATSSAVGGWHAGVTPLSTRTVPVTSGHAPPLPAPYRSTKRACANSVAPAGTATICTSPRRRTSHVVAAVSSATRGVVLFTW
mmetsp:Transcript_10529/g.25331  ORF Transcript_10529/g.25331 Transcript_10529/m.25331 type:complete len:253 (-) Transcript_10529:234-992(-)